MMRNACGCNDHPDSSLFIQTYKLISTYSLVKPPKGSNVSSAEIMQVLLSIKDIKNTEERKDQWNAQIDTILDKGCQLNLLTDAARIMEEHNYFHCSTSDYVLTYVAGFVARKGNRFAKYKVDNKYIFCDKCDSSLHLGQGEIVSDNYKLIELKSKGHLSKPSKQLLDLITILEKSTLDVVQFNNINANTLFEVTAAIDKFSPLPCIGCDNHQKIFTERIISFYLTTRMFFLTKQLNKNENIEKEKTREKRKLAKLTTTTVADLGEKKKKQN